jgi:di/tricarboxylate transporter
VIAIHRAGERIGAKLGDVRLRPGDLLLVIAGGDFKRHGREHRDFLIVAPISGEVPRSREKAPVVGLVTAGLFLVVGTGLMDILQASLLTAIALVALRVLTPGEARSAVDLNVIVVIASSFGLGTALATTGVASALAGLFIAPLANFGDLGLLLGILLATTLLTELVTNNAAAVLMFPIAVATAAQAGLDVRPFAMAVAVGASASFLSPIGYQTNTMVYGMGGYHFGDFARVGLPLTILMFIVCGLMIPLGWPLR